MLFQNETLNLYIYSEIFCSDPVKSCKTFLTQKPRIHYYFISLDNGKLLDSNNDDNP